MDPNASVCVKCGCAANNGGNFCANCGQPVAPGAVFCTSCGASMTPVAPAEAKSKMVAGLLGILVGALGVHNFYLGYTSKAVVQLLLTVLSCGVLGAVSSIWGLVEGIMILTGNIKTDGKGNPLKD